MADAVDAPEDFEEIYDLPDPRPYFRALGPLDYRMPSVVSGFLERYGGAIATARGRESLAVVDFACGYGTNGLLLKHEIGLSELHRYYEAPAPTTFLEADARFFAARRRPEEGLRLIGIDIAAEALAYAEAVGALDAAFAVDLLAEPPGPRLAVALADADLVIESGAIGDLLAPAMARLLDAGGDRPPWLLLAPRSDVDVTALETVLADRGYRVELCNRRPFRYRRFLGPEERAEVLAAVAALGRPPARWLDDAYFLIDLWLARPEADCRRWPIAGFAADGLDGVRP